ncbi:MAG: PAS domain-containing protein [Bacteroidota bacterium]|jgi:PAS domain S-box-containing protein
MTNLSSNTNCDAFRELRPAIPLLAAYEFMEISRSNVSEFTLLEDFAQNRNWTFDLNKVKRFLQDRKNTIVVTCEKEKIEWVSKGFSRMTGYDSEEAIGRFPRFLQGEDTSMEAKKAIRSKINDREKYSGKIVNYRKNGEKYTCKVEILPIFDKENSLVNFIAFEHEVEA